LARRDEGLERVQVLVQAAVDPFEFVDGDARHFRPRRLGRRRTALLGGGELSKVREVLPERNGDVEIAAFLGDDALPLKGANGFGREADEVCELDGVHFIFHFRNLSG
jgi:hypothetical protein